MAVPCDVRSAKKKVEKIEELEARDRFSFFKIHVLARGSFSFKIRFSFRFQPKVRYDST